MMQEANARPRAPPADSPGEGSPDVVLDGRAAEKRRVEAVEWKTRDGMVLHESDLRSISDRHLMNWLRYVDRLARGADSAIGAPDDDTSNAAVSALAYYDSWVGLLDEERKRRGLPSRKDQ